MINFNNKTFKITSNSAYADTNEDTLFHYKQNGDFITADYKGGGIKSGNLIATFNEDGTLQMQYHHINHKNELLTGVCCSVPEIMANGKIRITENWQWTCKTFLKGVSILDEV